MYRLAGSRAANLSLPPKGTIKEHNQLTDTKPQITSSLLAILGADIEALLGQHTDTGKVLRAELSILECKLKQ